jgi:8-amino-7-oxononanoate synthase
MNDTDQYFIDLIKSAVREISLRELGEIAPETNIADFGLDSVAMMELIGILEEDLSMRIADEEIASLRTVSDLLGLMRNRDAQSKELNKEAVEKPQPIEQEIAAIENFPEIKNLEARLSEIEKAGLGNPFFRAHDGIAANRTVIGGVEMINFSSYNYLGFSGHPEVSAAAKEATDRYGTSVSASRPVSGERPIHQALEQGIAGHIGVEDAIVFVSGHATNVTTIGHLFDRNDVILHDSLCHDSIMQGIYLSGAKRLPFPHGDSAELERLLNQIRSQHRRALICTEGLFSMDGDICDLPALIDIKKKYQCNLIIDEAHSMGILGPCGRGIAHHYPGINPEDVDLWMGTLSKSFASCGGYIAGKKPLIRYLKYTAPGFLYSVGMPAPNAAAALKSLELMQRHPEIVEQLRMRSKLFLELARANGINTGAAIGAAVVPAIIGNSIKCMRISQALAEQKINVQPIVYPAVEENASRLRFFISATHSEQEIRFTVDALSAEIKKVAQ